MLRNDHQVTGVTFPESDHTFVGSTECVGHKGIFAGTLLSRVLGEARRKSEGSGLLIHAIKCQPFGCGRLKILNFNTFQFVKACPDIFTRQDGIVRWKGSIDHPILSARFPEETLGSASGFMIRGINAINRIKINRLERV